ncbi:BnaCnng05700D [Brassica napus]|uniref:BnaCnng05700D protein n=1 Tax=Brassica napus TaxID=3708 RepID=A0A078GU29_BRANA|nr:BnaCnng05700D [Brassica napus]
MRCALTHHCSSSFSLQKLFDRLKVDGDDDEADKGGTITVGIFWNVTIAQRKERIGRRIRFLDGGLTEEKKVRLSGIRRSDERQQEEDMDAAIEVDLKLRDRRRWMNVYTKSNHNPQLSNKAMNLGAQTGDIDDLEKKLDPSVFKIGSTQAAKKRWVAMGKQVSRKVQHVEDKVKESLLQIQQGLELDKESLNSLKTRKLLVTQGWTGYSDVEKGPNYAPKRKIFATDLTRENLHIWKELEFKEYNFNAKGQPLDASYLHPLLKVSDSLSFCPSDQQSFMSELDSQVSTAFDPFADANAEDSGAGTKEYVHIRVQQRNGRKSLTKKEYIYSNIVKDLKKEFCCNSTLVHDSELGHVHVYFTARYLRTSRKSFVATVHWLQTQ